MAILSTISALATFVPAITKWVAGDKAAEAAEAVANVAMKVTGAPNPMAAAAQIQNDPSARADFVLAMEAKRLEFDKLYLEDKQHAREQQVEVLKHAKGRVSREFIYWYAWFMSISSMVYFAAITFVPIPESSTRFADTILGFMLGTVLGGIVTFFYGASKPVRDDE
ncbi:phage protein [Vibrio maritimus]|uniref:Phage protein n=1 Tax=Vibrio maritimus TaxID=990268 RepID=A0A090SUG0_9VIBR|nr:phage protein [Vibrio maritimus]